MKLQRLLISHCSNDKVKQQVSNSSSTFLKYQSHAAQLLHMNYLSLSDQTLIYASALRSRIQQQKAMITLLYNLTKEWVSKVCNVLWCWSDQEISLLIQFDTDISASCNTTSPPYFTLVLRWSSLNSWVEPKSAPSQESWPILPIRFASFSSLIISDQIFIGIRLCLE